MRSIYQSRHLAVVALVLAATLSACGDDDGGGAVADPDTGAEVVEDAASGGGDETDTGGDPADDGSGADQDQPAPTGEPRAILTMQGGTHELRIDPDWSMAAPATCEIDHENEEATVVGMVSDSGYEVQMFPTFGWAASVIEPDGTAWMAGAADPNPDADYSVEISEGRLVVDGTWGDTSLSTTTDIRMELICP